MRRLDSAAPVRMRPLRLYTRGTFDTGSLLEPPSCETFLDPLASRDMQLMVILDHPIGSEHVRYLWV
jgi:hypothetical protein